MSVKLTVDASKLANLDLSSIVDHIAAKAERAFHEDIGPHYVDVAKAHAPVSDERFNPQIGSGAFQSVELIERVAPGINIGAKIARLKALQEGTTEVDLENDAEFFRIKAGPKRKPNRDAGATPERLAFRRGAVVGAARHRPGTLRDSIHVESVTREGQTVKMRIVASAPYAAAIAKGFRHLGGRNKKGKVTEIAANPFMKDPLVNVRDRLKNPEIYR